jgi:hypothetical protein
VLILLLPMQNECWQAVWESRVRLASDAADKCRYNHHGAHRTFHGHAGWAEAIVAVEAPEADHFQGVDFSTTSSSQSGAAARPRRRLRVHLDPAAERTEQSGAPEDVYTSPDRSKLAIWEEKRRLIERNETVRVMAGSLQRAPRPRPREAERARSASDARAATSDPSEVARQEQSAWVEEAGRRGMTMDGDHVKMRQAPCSAAPAATVPPAATDRHIFFDEAHSRSAGEASTSDASDTAREGGQQGQRGLAERRSGSTAASRRQRTREYIFTACATGVVHQWALDEQLQSDEYVVRT